MIQQDLSNLWLLKAEATSLNLTLIILFRYVNLTQVYKLVDVLIISHTISLKTPMGQMKVPPVLVLFQSHVKLFLGRENCCFREVSSFQGVSLNVQRTYKR